MAKNITMYQNTGVSLQAYTILIKTLLGAWVINARKLTMTSNRTILNHPIYDDYRYIETSFQVHLYLFHQGSPVGSSITAYSEHNSPATWPHFAICIQCSETLAKPANLPE